MNEAGVWAYLKRGMQGKWHATRIESSSGNGVPDVTYGINGSNGWLELKYIKEWPKRPTTKVKLPLRPEQKHWINARGCIAGNVAVLIRIEDYFFLLKWWVALNACDGWTQEQWFKNSTVFWFKEIDFSKLALML